MSPSLMATAGKRVKRFVTWDDEAVLRTERVEVARGSVLAPVPLVAMMTVLGGLSLALIGLFLDALSVFVVLVGAFCGLVGSGLWSFCWAVSAGRVRYEAEGSRIYVRRGRKLVADLDTARFDSVDVEGRLTWRSAFAGSQFFGGLLGLPHVVCRRRINPWEEEVVELPHILIWGKDAITGFQARLDHVAGRDAPT